MSRRSIDLLIEWMTGLTRARATLYAGLCTLLLSAATLTFGHHYSVTALGILPMVLAAWTLGERAGLLVGLFNAALQVWSAGTGPAYFSGIEVSVVAGVWNVLMRALAVILIVALVGGFRRSYDGERQRARTDSLTGALNKLAFDDRVETTLAIARRHGLCVVLAYADLDDFKAVNDRFGHDVGDMVLKGVAAAARARLRPTDSFARAGGDEFMALLPVATVDDGYKAVGRLHRALSSSLDEMGYGVGCSMGAVVMEDGGSDEAGLVQLADALMYEVKRAGKGALRIATLAGDPDARVRPLRVGQAGSGSWVPAAA